MTRPIDADPIFRPLVADDDLETRKLIGTLIAKILDIDEQDVLYAKTKDELWTRLKASNPNLIILNMHMDEHMLPSLKKLKSPDSKYKDIPIIVVTAHSTILKTCLEYGADRVFGKPFDVEELGQAIKEAYSHTNKRF